MGEHRWLTEEQIEKLLDGNELYKRTGPELRLIADWREMRKLIKRLVMKPTDAIEEPGIAMCHLGRYCLYCDYEGAFDGSLAHHDEDCPIEEGCNMMEATADD